MPPDPKKAKPPADKKPAAQAVDPRQLVDLAVPVKSKDQSKREMERLAKAIEDRGLVDDEMLQRAMMNIHDESAVSLKQTLVSMNFATEEDILDALATDMGLERVDLAKINFNEELLDQISPEIAKKYQVVPVRSTEDELCIAISDPNNIQAVDDLGRLLHRIVRPMIATEEDIQKAIKRFYTADDYQGLYEQMAESDNPVDKKEYEDLSIDVSKPVEGETPEVVRFVDLLFKQAVHERASDIHLEPNRLGLGIRVRIDGVLLELPQPPRAWHNAIISRLKVLAGLDLAEKRIPLDGRIKLSMPDKKLDLRVSTLPTIFGESIVMRILDQSAVMMGLEDVGFLPDTVRQFNQLIKSPNGIILMTGPTGSGKTTTLYAALGTLNTPEHKLMTLEDPIEYQIVGINQVQIHQEIGLDFPTGLRGLLRQSPDVILVGEIRDMETAENAIRAALTGHLVFSTLHTNDAPSATVRLADMGVKPYLIASSLQAVIAQRLVRRICSNCKRPYKPDPQEIKDVGFDPEDYRDAELFRGGGCERCSKSGYRGRTAIHEVFVVDSEIRRRIIRSEASTRLKRYAISQGMRSLRMDGWEKTLLGQTTADEVYRTVGGED